jgi:hypothetical protein
LSKVYSITAKRRYPMLDNKDIQIEENGKLTLEQVDAAVHSDEERD